MKTSIIINPNNSIMTELEDIITQITTTLELNDVQINRVLISSNFDVDYEKLMYDDSNDFIITIGEHKSSIKGIKKVFNFGNNIDGVSQNVIKIVDYVNTCNPNKHNRMIIKTFGISEKNILSLIDNTSDDIIIRVIGTDLDLNVIIEYDNDLESSTRQNIISDIYEKLRNYIYTDDNLSIYELLINLLNVNNKTLSLAETITGGVITENLHKVENSNDAILLGINALQAEGLTKLLDLSTEQIKQNNPVEIVYEMAAGVLEKSGSDLCLATYGTKSDQYSYIAVGDMDGIHVYKSKCNAIGKGKQNIIAKSAIYYLIKKIKQNDLFFNQIVV